MPQILEPDIYSDIRIVHIQKMSNRRANARAESEVAANAGHQLRRDQNLLANLRIAAGNRSVLCP